MESRTTSIALLVPRQHVKPVKTALEGRGALGGKITVEEDGDGDGDARGVGSRMRIPTTLSREEIPGWERGEEEIDEEPRAGTSRIHVASVLEFLGLLDLSSEPHISSFGLDRSASDTTCRHTPTQHKSNKNPLLQSLAAALSSLPPDLLQSLDLTVEALVTQFPTTYTVYKPLLLLPPNALSSAAWRKLLSNVGAEGGVMGRVWEGLASGLGMGCVAVNGGIPPRTATSRLRKDGRGGGTEDEENGRFGNEEEEEGEVEQEEENILRLPSTLHPLHGPFGPPPTHQRQHAPSAADFASALWVSCRQNGVYQTWAPRYTMFSRGNVKEKARVLQFASKTVRRMKEDGGQEGEETEKGCTAIDLYAGIGYFAFSYRKAGVSKVVCFEMNPWSVEGLRRGAEGNGWSVRIYSPSTPPSSISASSGSSVSSTEEEEHPESLSSSTGEREDQATPHHPARLSGHDSEPSILVFPESNEHAISRLSTLSLSLPPIRHVNCGFLPSSRLSWRTAIQLLDVKLGGWIHAHENVGVGDVERRRAEVEAEMEGYLGEWDGERDGGGRRGKKRVECRHVERVKTYAPGVLHVVFDVWVEGDREAGERV